MSTPPRMREYYLQPGEYRLGDAGCRVKTLLGSCVSITLWHPVQRIGAMSHSLLATRVRSGNEADDPRYGDEAMRLMVRDLLKKGVDPTECEAKLFGGGNMFPGHARPEALNVGRRNGEAAREELQRHNIRLVSESLYGTGHRQVIFDIATGNVWARQVNAAWAGAQPLPAFVAARHVS